MMLKFYDGWNANDDIAGIMGIALVHDGGPVDYEPLVAQLSALGHLVATEEDVPDEVALIRQALRAHVYRANSLGDNGNAGIVKAIAECKNNYAMLSFTAMVISSLWN